MKNTQGMVNAFFAFLLVVILGIFFFNAINQPLGNGLVLNKDNPDLSKRVSIHYILKNVHNAEDYLAQHKSSYFRNRDKVKSSNLEFGKTKNAESGSANEVTSIVVNYRGFDTLGEVTVLFISILGLGMLLHENKKKYWAKPSLIVRTGANFLFPFIVLFGVYVFVHGHLTPGGGFPGGTIIASAALLLILGLKDFKNKLTMTKIIESLAGLTFAGLGLVGLFTNGSFLTNFLPSGTMGLLVSSGITALIYIAVGIKVAAELSSGIMEMNGGGEE